MSKMLRTHRNTIGNLMITLLFVGGCVFLLTGSWDASETEAATGCCGGGGAALPSLTANSGGDLGSGISMDAKSTGGCCGGEGKITLSSSGNNDDEEECGECGCYVEGCSDCLSSFIACGGGCECPTDPEPGNIGGQANDQCESVCSATTDATELCDNDCGY